MGVRKAIALAVALAAGATGGAELQNVTVGGKIEIYGAWYSDIFEASGGSIRIPAGFLPKRPIGPFGTLSPYRLDGHGHNTEFFEQRTRLYTQADFTNEVTAFIEFDQVMNWGDNFRSNYLNGFDFYTTGTSDVQLFQSYVDIHGFMGSPIHARIGRQTMDFGSGWLVGSDPGPDPAIGLSFDALRLTWEWEPAGVVVDAWAAKLAENGGIEEDGDVDFYGVYATYTPLSASSPGVSRPEHLLFSPLQMMYSPLRLAPFNRGRRGSDETLQIEAYWMMVRDAITISDTNFVAPVEWLEDGLGIDDYDVTTLHTVGSRGVGRVGPFEYELEVAYQFGDADALGSLFVGNGLLYGDDDSEWSTWGGHAEFAYAPLENPFRITRVFIGGSYYGSDDERDLSFREWISPFYQSEASVSFNRLFSSWREDSFLDGSDMSNFWKANVGATFAVSDAVEVGFSWSYYELVEGFASPVSFRFGDFRVPVAPALSFWTDDGSTEIGHQSFLSLSYAYSEDLSFEIGWSHFFTGEAFNDGGFSNNNGLLNLGGRDDEDADYVYFYTSLEF